MATAADSTLAKDIGALFSGAVRGPGDDEPPASLGDCAIRFYRWASEAKANGDEQMAQHYQAEGDRHMQMAEEAFRRGR
jgi:hypothetical protein